MFRVFFFQTFKHEVNRVLEILVVLAGFRRIYHLKQRREVLLVLRGFRALFVRRDSVRGKACHSEFKSSRKLFGFRIYIGNCVEVA